MANSIYYGSSTTSANTAVKQVIIQGLSEDIRDESFLQVGDMLIVYFSFDNLTTAPSIKLFNGDSEHEISTDSDTGKFIKLQAADSNATGAWSAGETCTFTFTFGASGTYYWSLNGSAKGTSTSYGKVKLSDNLNPTEEELDSAITLGAAIQLFNSKMGNSLSYVPGIPQSAENITLGTLSLVDDDSSTDISTVAIQMPPLQELQTYTSELYNNGPRKDSGSTDTAANIGAGNPYLTRIIPGSLSFRESIPLGSSPIGIMLYDSETETESVAYEIADNFGNSTINSKGNLNMNAVGDINLTVTNGNDISILGGDLILDKNLNCDLDIELDEGGRAVGGTDKDLYNAILDLGWSDCL